MAKFRDNVKTGRSKKTVNRAGGEAFEQSPKLELVSLLLTSFVKDSFYDSAGERLDRLDSLVAQIEDKAFLAKAGIFARNEFGMRSVTHALLADVAHNAVIDTGRKVTVKSGPDKGKKRKIWESPEWLTNALFLGVRRVDDVLEIMGRYRSKYGKETNALKRGLAEALSFKFDEYQLAKYRGERSGLSLIDAFNLLHPTPRPGMEKAFEKLINGDLKSTETWEAKLTEAGKEAAEIKDTKQRSEKLKELKEEAWKGLVESGKIGYFALLRNLRNILESAPDLVDPAVALLTNETRIKRELVLPFRYLTAVKALEGISGKGSRKVITALYDAIDISLANVPVFDGDTLVVVDDSGSMTGGWRNVTVGSTKVAPLEIASLFAAALYKSNDADLMRFSDDASYVTMNPRDSVMTIARKVVDQAKASGTNFHAPFERANRAYDRIVILSDEQGWMGYSNPGATFNKYKNKYKCNPKVYLFDLTGYGDMQFPENDVYCIAGWSDKVFDLMKGLEQDRQAMISTIEAVDLSDKAVADEKAALAKKFANIKKKKGKAA